MDPLLKQPLQKFLESQHFIGPDREAHFVVAFSGGRDSTALLHSLAQLRSAYSQKVKITAAYYWHPWRPLQEDLLVVHQHCKALNVQWIMLTPDLTLPKTETAARQDRYQQLARLTHDLGATALLTAHHQDDQVETILFRILRGTGIDGMTGIPELRMLAVNEHHHVCLARPFLDLPRSSIDAYIEAHQLRYLEDPTNLDTTHKRNYLRRELLPKIETAFPRARQSLMRFAELTAGDLEIIQSKVDDIWRDIYNPEAETLDEIRFTQLAHSFKRRIVRRFLEAAGVETSYHRVEDVIAFIEGRNRKFQGPGLYSLDGKRFLSVYRNVISIETPENTEIESVKISIPGELSHRQLRTTVMITPLTPEQRLKPVDFSKLGDDQVYVDLSRFAGQELELRTRKKGDRIKPLGMTSPIKLKRFFINRCVPRFKRDTVPILAAEDQVLWAVGVGLSDEIRVKDRPTHKITITRG